MGADFFVLFLLLSKLFSIFHHIMLTVGQLLFIFI